MVAPPTQDAVSPPQPPEQYAATLLRAGKSKEEIWQALVDRRVEPSRATEIVTAVTSGDGIVCSGCQSLVLRASATFSASGEPVCRDCALRSDVVEWQQRAARTQGPEMTIRRCRRCSKPAMSCVAVNELKWRRGDRIPSYTFRCGACGHSFTGYTGPGPVVWFVGLAGASIAVAVFRQPLGGGDTVGLVVCVALALFFLYRMLVWKLHPEVH